MCCCGCKFYSRFFVKFTHNFLSCWVLPHQNAQHLVNILMFNKTCKYTVLNLHCVINLICLVSNDKMVLSSESKHPLLKHPLLKAPKQPLLKEPKQPLLKEPKQPLLQEPKQPLLKEPKQPHVRAKLALF